MGYGVGKLAKRWVAKMVGRWLAKMVGSWVARLVGRWETIKLMFLSLEVKFFNK
jgi:hypothetical protein